MRVLLSASLIGRTDETSQDFPSSRLGEVEVASRGRGFVDFGDQWSWTFPVSNRKSTPPPCSEARNVDRRNDPQTRPTSAASRTKPSACILTSIVSRTLECQSCINDRSGQTTDRNVYSFLHLFGRSARNVISLMTQGIFRYMCGFTLNTPDGTQSIPHARTARQTRPWCQRGAASLVHAAYAPRAPVERFTQPFV